MTTILLVANQKTRITSSSQSTHTSHPAREKNQLKWMKKMSNCAYKITHSENSFFLSPWKRRRAREHFSICIQIGFIPHTIYTHTAPQYYLLRIFPSVFSARFLDFSIFISRRACVGDEKGMRKMATNTSVVQDKLLYFPIFNLLRVLPYTSRDRT